MRTPAGRRPGGAGIVRGCVIAAGYVLLYWLERRRPLRERVDDDAVHTARNLAMAGLAAATVHLIESPLVIPVARVTQRRGWGLVPALRLPAPLAAILSIVLLDYTLYLWHAVVHRVPFLWRFHLVHHIDRDVDASTALRFHAGELTVSIPWRAAQIAAIGASPAALSGWQTLTLLSVMFHHSNLRLPLGLERAAGLLLVTPRMHGIHHSIVKQESDSNFSSGLSVWDRLHGTLRLNVPQAAITPGVPAYPSAEDEVLTRALALPLTHDRPSWSWPDGGAPTPFPVRTRPDTLVP